MVAQSPEPGAYVKNVRPIKNCNIKKHYNRNIYEYQKYINGYKMKKVVKYCKFTLIVHKNVVATNQN